MKYNRAALLIFAILSLFVLAACGGGGGDDGDSNSSSDSTEEAASGGDEATPVGGVQIAGTASLTNDSGTFSVIYPESWVPSIGEEITLANSQEALDAAVPADGQVRATVDFIPDGSPIYEELGLGRSPQPPVVINATIEALNAAGSQYELSAPNQFINAGKIGARATGTVTIDDTVYSAIVVAYDEGGGMLRMIFVAPEGQIAQYDTTILEIAGSVEFEEGAAEAESTEAAADATEEAADEVTEEATAESTPEN